MCFYVFAPREVMTDDENRAEKKKKVISTTLSDIHLMQLCLTGKKYSLGRDVVIGLK